MSIFNKIMKELGGAADYTVKKTGEVTGAARVRMEIRAANNRLQKCFEGLGRTVYKNERGIGERAEVDAFLAEADSIKAEIQSLRRELARLQGLVICPACNAQISDQSIFCPLCGVRLPVEEKSAEPTAPTEEEEIPAEAEAPVEETLTPEAEAESPEASEADSVSEEA